MASIFDQQMEFDYFYDKEPEKYQFYRLPASLFKDNIFRPLSTDAKLLYAFLLDRAASSYRHDMLDHQNRVYVIFRLTEAIQMLGCAKGKAVRIFKELEDFGLITRLKKGQGNPDTIYVKDFTKIVNNETDFEITDFRGSKIEPQEVLKSNFKTSQNGTPRSSEKEPQEVRNLNPGSSKIEPPEVSKPNLLYNNHTLYNNNNTNILYESDQSNHSVWSEETVPYKSVDNYTYYYSLLAKNLEPDLIVQNLRNSGKNIEADSYMDLFNIILNALCSPAPTIRINGRDMDAARVKNKFLQLDEEDLLFVIDKIIEASQRVKIKNVKAYALTCLYFVKDTISMELNTDINYHVFGEGRNKKD